MNVNKNKVLRFKAKEFSIAPEDIKAARYNAQYDTLMIVSKSLVRETSHSGDVR